MEGDGKTVREKEHRCLRMVELFIPAVIRPLNSGVLPFVMCTLNEGILAVMLVFLRT